MRGRKAVSRRGWLGPRALSAVLILGLGVLGPAGPARALVPRFPGYVLVGADGGVFAFGADRYAGSLAGRHLAARIVAVLPNADATRSRDGSVHPSGYLLVDAAGRVYPFGATHSSGDLSRARPSFPVVDAVGDSRGYLLVSADGGVFTFGQVRFRGSLAGRPLPAPIVGADFTANDLGYWLVDRQGHVYPFGDATVRARNVAGPVDERPTSSPVVGIAGNSRNDGYWIATGDGHVTSFGSAPPVGDMRRAHLAAPIVRIAAGSRPDSYYLLGADGGVFAFNTAFLGSTGGRRLAQPVTGMYFGFIPGSCAGLPPGFC